MAIEKIRGIVTDVLKHSDRHNIITLFTREHGRLAMLSTAGNGKTARVRNASLMPLSVITADININSSRELHFLGRFQREALWKDIYFNPAKSAVALFISEFLNNYIRNSGADPLLWDYAADAIARLDSASRGIANFHLAFLIDFMTYAGIRPDLSEQRNDSWFDMRGGSMTLVPPAHQDRLAPGEARFLPLLLRLNLNTYSHFKFNSTQRNALLKGILKYYGIHFPGLANLKSPEILSEIFSTK